MNLLIVGTNKPEILHHLPDTFLFIDDGALIDQLHFPARRKITHLDLDMHCFNPLKDMSYKRARDFLSVINAVFPEGESTLTRKSSNFELLKALTGKPRKLQSFITPLKDNPGTIDADQKIQTLLLSPVLKKFLCSPTNFPLNGILIARLDRTVLSEFDCFVIANLLISAYKGPVVIPDFGFYSCAFHTSLIRQNRLIAGVNFLDETPLRNSLLLIDHKIAAHCIGEDAKVLASYAGLVPDFTRADNPYNDFIQKSIR